MPRSRLFVFLVSWLALVVGCATSRPQVAPADDAPFFCKPEVPPKPPRPVPVVSLPTGKLDITCEPESSPASEEEGEEEEEDRYHLTEKKRLLARRCRFIVQSAPLVDVALALSAATGYSFSVQSELLPLRVGVSLHEATLQQFLGTLSSEQGRVALSVSEGIARFEWRERRATPSLGCYPDFGVRLVRIPPGVSGRQLASVVCQHLLTEDGRVSLLGQQLFVWDARIGLEKVETLVRSLDPASRQGHD